MDVMGYVLISIAGLLFFWMTLPLWLWLISADLSKRYCCKIGWHSIFVGFESTGFDGCSQHARCKWCGYEGMIDGQGNLF